MRRRALLGSVGAVFGAGCTGILNRGPDGPPPTDDPTDAAPTTRTDGPDEPMGELLEQRVTTLPAITRTYALTGVRTRTAAGVLAAVGVTGRSTTENPPQVAATVRNGTEQERVVDLRGLPGFGQLGSSPPRTATGDKREFGSFDDGLVLAPRAGHALTDETPAVRRDDEGHWRLAGDLGDPLPDRIALAPGETVTGEYALVGRSGGSGRPVGIYAFGDDGDALAVTVWNTENPGPSELSRFAGQSVPAFDPSYPFRAGRGEPTDVGWYHEADAGTPVYVRPASERTDAPTPSAATVVNHSRETLSCGGVTVAKVVDGRWFALGTPTTSDVCRRLPPGATETYTPAEAYPKPFGAGRYGIVVGYGATTPATGALFDVRGDPLSLPLTEDATASRDGGVVTVETEFAGGTAESDPATLALRPAETATDGRVVAEQLYGSRYRAARNAIAAAADGVEAVRVRTDDRRVERVLRGAPARSVRYRDRTVELRRASDAGGG